MGIDEKYGRITVESGSIGADEPVMLFRAQDALLPEVISFYAQRCREEGSPDRHLEWLGRMFDRVQAWQEGHPTKIPSSDGSEADLHARPDLAGRIEDAETHPERHASRPEQTDGAESELTRVRRQLVSASQSWYRRSEGDFAKDGKISNPGDVMAASYSYTLAAILKAVEAETGVDVAESLSRLANEILENGDFDDWNADVAVTASQAIGDDGLTDTERLTATTGGTASP